MQQLSYKHHNFHSHSINVYGCLKTATESPRLVSGPCWAAQLHRLVQTQTVKVPLVDFCCCFVLNLRFLPSYEDWAFSKGCLCCSSNCKIHHNLVIDKAFSFPFWVCMWSTNYDTKELFFVSSVICLYRVLLSLLLFPSYKEIDCRSDLPCYAQSSSLEDCSSSQKSLTPPTPTQKKKKKKDKTVFCKLAMCGKPAYSTCLRYWGHVSLRKGRNLESGEERMAGQPFTLVTLFLDVLGLALDFTWWELKRLLKGEQFPTSSQHPILKCRNSENDKASRLGANSPLDKINKCLQSSDFLGFATQSPVKAVLTACTCTQ